MKKKSALSITGVGFNSKMKWKSNNQRFNSKIILLSSMFIVLCLFTIDALARVTYAYGTAANGCRFKMTSVYDDNNGNYLSGFTEFYLCPPQSMAPSLEVGVSIVEITRSISCMNEPDVAEFSCVSDAGEEMEPKPEELIEMKYGLYLKSH